MLNYMRSEAYRLIRDKKIWILFFVFGVLLSSVVGVLAYFQNYAENFPYGNTKFALSNIYASLTMLLYVAGGFVLLLNDGDKTHVYKNSIAFGIKRSTVLLGKLLVQAIIAVFSCLVLAGFYAFLCDRFLLHSDVGEFNVYWNAIFSGSLGLLAALTGVYMFMMIADTMSLAMIYSVAAIVVVPTMLNLLGRRIVILNIISKCFPYIAMAEYSNHTLTFEVTGRDTFTTLLTGFCWLTGFLIFGMILFKRKEIR